MARAWTCTIGHGTFLQSGMDALPLCTRTLPGLVVEGRSATNGMSRYVCPVCAAAGLPGFVRPATAAEVDALELSDTIPKPATEAAAAFVTASAKDRGAEADTYRDDGARRGDGMASASMHANVSEGVTGGESAAPHLRSDLYSPWSVQPVHHWSPRISTEAAPTAAE